MADLINKFSRVTSSGEFISQIDGLRFSAIAGVVLFHLDVCLEAKKMAPALNGFFEEGLRDLFKSGHWGVQLFFCISGFILGLPFARRHIVTPGKKIDLGRYYLRRLTRIEPPYFLSMILFFWLSILIHKYNFPALFPSLLASLAYVHSILFHEPSMINPVAWSLEIEVQFYVIAPFLTYVFICKPVFRRVLLLFLMVFFPLLQYMFPFKTISFFGEAQNFFAGFLLVDLYVSGYLVAKIKNIFWDFALIPVVTIMVLLNSNEKLDNFFIPFACIFFFLASFRGGLFCLFIKNRIVAVIGGMCYSIYLLHFLLLPFLCNLTNRLFHFDDYLITVAINFLICIPSILIAGACFFLIIEKPCMVPDWLPKLCDKIMRLYRKHCIS